MLTVCIRVEVQFCVGAFLLVVQRLLATQVQGRLNSCRLLLRAPHHSVVAIPSGFFGYPAREATLVLVLMACKQATFACIDDD